MSKLFELNKDKDFVIVYYSYHNNNFIYDVWISDHYNFVYQFQKAYYEYMKQDKKFYIAIIENEALSYLENLEMDFRDPYYRASNEIQKAIEECDIREWLKDFKKEKYDKI